jgi:hypothetical protein
MNAPFADMCLMTPHHSRWLEFCCRLNAWIDRIGCAAEGPGALDGARSILADMDCDVTRSLEFFREHGGHCDCEILMNVEPLVQMEEDGGIGDAEKHDGDASATH